MEIYIKTHIVQKDETLESIVSKYNISDVEMLRYFHNQNAPKDHNHLGRKAEAGQEIFIPSKLDIEKILSERKEKEIQQSLALKNKLLTPDIYAIKQNYRVKIKYSSVNHSENVEELEFDAHIKYLKATDENLPILQYRKENYLINGEVSSSKLYDLALYGTEFLFPLEFSLHPETFKPYKITNIKELKSRWIKKKEQAQRMYKDVYASRYLKTMDEAINEGVSKYFMNDFFIQFLFAPYTNFVDGQAVTERFFHTYRIAYQDVMNMEIQDDLITIHQNAYCIDLRTPQQILAKWRPDEVEEKNGDDLLESDISGVYHLNKRNKILQNANIKISTLFYDEKEIIEIEIDGIS